MGILYFIETIFLKEEKSTEKIVWIKEKRYILTTYKKQMLKTFHRVDYISWISLTFHYLLKPQGIVSLFWLVTNNCRTKISFKNVLNDSLGSKFIFFDAHTPGWLWNGLLRPKLYSWCFILLLSRLLSPLIYTRLSEYSRIFISIHFSSILINTEKCSYLVLKPSQLIPHQFLDSPKVYQWCPWVSESTTSPHLLHSHLLSPENSQTPWFLISQTLFPERRMIWEGRQMWGAMPITHG